MEDKCRSPLFFQHIAKTAGTSIGEFLRRDYFVEELSTGFNIDSIYQERVKNPNRFDYYSGHVDLDFIRMYFPGISTIAFFRDPIRRVISQYLNWKDPHRHQERWLTNASTRDLMADVQEMTLLEFLSDNRRQIRGSVSNVQVRSASGSPSFEGLYDCGYYNRKLVDKAFDNVKNHYTTFGLVEYLDKSMNRLFDRLEIIPRKTVPSKNVSKNELQILPEAFELARSLNLMDIDFYERCCEEFEKYELVSESDIISRCLQQYSGRSFFNADDNIFGDGWNYLERTSDGIEFRWSMSDSVFYLPYIQMRSLDLYCVGYVAEDFVDDVSLEIDGFIASCNSSWAVHGGYVLSFEFDTSFVRPLKYLTATLRCKPILTGEGERGIAVSSVYITGKIDP